jgi:hypothetical protein
MINSINSIEIKKETKNNFENEETKTKNTELFQKSNEENIFHNNIYDLSRNEEFKELKILVQKLKNADDKKSEEIQNLKLLVQNLEQEDKKISKKIVKLQNRFKDQSLQISFLNLKLQRISYRDVSKIVLDKMIDYVDKRSPNFLKEINGRKKQLEKIIQDYDFQDIQFMKNPLIEIKNKYYNSNDYSHIPKLLQQYREEPYGLNKIRVEDIVKNYYEVIVDSKSDQVYLFLKQKLDIENITKLLYNI